jgi:hypothetical protein
MDPLGPLVPRPTGRHWGRDPLRLFGPASHRPQLVRFRPVSNLGTLKHFCELETSLGTGCDLDSELSANNNLEIAVGAESFRTIEIATSCPRMADYTPKLVFGGLGSTW